MEGVLGSRRLIVTFIRLAPQIRSPKRARRTRGGTKSSNRDVAKMISEEYEKNRPHFRKTPWYRGKISDAPSPKKPIDRLNMTNASAMLKIEI